MIGDASGHCGADPESFVDAGQVVKDEIERQRGNVIVEHFVQFESQAMTLPIVRF